MKFRELVLELHLPQIFCHTHINTQTDIFQVKSCSKHSKKCKSIRNQMPKIFMKLILSSIYIEGSKNDHVNKHDIHAVTKTKHDMFDKMYVRHLK